MWKEVYIKLFDSNTESISGWKKYSESNYQYLNTRDTPECVEMRKKFEKWFSHFPEAEQLRLFNEFTSDSDEKFFSAFFELLLYELFSRLDYNIVVHPDLKNSNKHPDFLLTNGNGEEFYFEAAISTDMSVEEVGRKKIFNVIHDIINEVNTSNFFIRIEINKLPDKPIRARRLREFLQNKLDKLDPDHLEILINKFGWDAVPKWNFSDDGFEIEFEPIPNDKEYRTDRIKRPIGITSYPYEIINFKKPILTTLKTKAKKYKGLDRPYIIAVNIVGITISKQNILETLFGVYIFNLGERNQFINSNTLSDGFWYTKNQPSYTRVSAIIFTKNLYPWSIGREEFKLYVNPWAKFPYSGDLDSLSMFAINHNKIVETEGISINQILGIPQGWPHNLS